MISGKTAIYGIFGHPVEHTFSPGMHNAAFKKIAANACYVPFSVPPETLERAVRAIVPLGLRGLNITVPHKEKVIPLLDDITGDARVIGAVNTIEVREGKLIGHNTDGRGFLRSLVEGARFRPRGKTFAITGAGGAARAVGCSLALAGARAVLFHDVDMRKATKLARELSRNAGPVARALSADAFAEEALLADCLINATPMGLRPEDPLPVPQDVIGKRHLVCDLVYNPKDTKLLQKARSRGAKTLGGIGMLLYQGVIAFEIWTGKKAPVETMRKALAVQMAERRK
jgi:shikimate dehydrogenase